MRREPFVEERVVGADEVQDARVAEQHALEEQFGLAQHVLAQVVVPVRELEQVGRLGRDVAQLQPLLREVRDERVRARVGEHPPHLPLEHLGSPSRPASAPSSSSSSGMLLQMNSASRDASVAPSTRYTAPGAADEAGSAPRNRNSGPLKMRASASWMPRSKSRPPPLPRA